MPADSSRGPRNGPPRAGPTRRCLPTCNARWLLAPATTMRCAGDCSRARAFPGHPRRPRCACCRAGCDAALAEALDDDANRADVIWRRAFALEDSGDFAAAALLAQRSLELALAAGATTAATKAYAGLGYDLMRLGRFGRHNRPSRRPRAGTGQRQPAAGAALPDRRRRIARALGDPLKATGAFRRSAADHPRTRQPRQRSHHAQQPGRHCACGSATTPRRAHLQASLEVARTTGNRTVNHWRCRTWPLWPTSRAIMLRP